MSERVRWSAAADVYKRRRIRRADAVNLRHLAGAERFLLVETPDALQQALAAEDFVEAGDAAGETVRGVEEGGVAVGDFIRELEHFRRNRHAVAIREEFDGFLCPHGPVAEQSSDDTHRIRRKEIENDVVVVAGGERDVSSEAFIERAVDICRRDDVDTRCIYVR